MRFGFAMRCVLSQTFSDPTLREAKEKSCEMAILIENPVCVLVLTKKFSLGISNFEPPQL